MPLRSCAGVRGKGCPALVRDRERCDDCEAVHTRGRKARGLTGQRGSTGKWRRARLKALIRDGYRCVRCDRPYPLEVDHIDGNPDNNDIDNLQTLCGPYEEDGVVHVGCHHEKHGAAG